MENKEHKICRDELSQILNRTTAWIENCDTKASIILSGIGVITGIVLASDYLSKIIAIFRYMIKGLGIWTGLHVLLSVVAIICIIAGALCLLLVLVGKTDTKGLEKKGVHTSSLSFFSAISKQPSLGTYKANVLEHSENDWIDELISQIYICSIICDTKFKNYKRGLVFSVAGFALFTAMMIVGFLLL